MGCSYKMHEFPSDTQSCAVGFAVTNPPVNLSVGNVTTIKGFTVGGFRSSIAWSSGAGAVAESSSDNRPYIYVSFTLQRDSWPYMLSIVAPSVFVCLMVALLFAQVQLMGPRLQVSVIAELSLFVCWDRLERIGAPADKLE